MPSLFGKKKSTTTSAPPSPAPSTEVKTPSSSSAAVAPDKVSSPTKSTKSSSTKPKGHFVRERQKSSAGSTSSAHRPKESRHSKSFGHRKSHKKSSEDIEHPLNLPPDELRRLSALSTMSSPVRDGDAHADNRSDSTDEVVVFTPKQPTGNKKQHHHHEQTQAPEPPPHKSPSNGIAGEETPTVDAEACKAAGNKFYKAGQYEKAIQEYTEAIQADPQSSTYLSNRAAAYMAANQYSDALRDCQRADELEPNSAKILLRLAKVLTALGQPTDALEVYDRIEPPATAKDRAVAQSMSNHISGAQQSLADSPSGSMVLHAIDQAQKGLGPGISPPRKWQLMRGEAYLKMGTENSVGEAQNVAMSLLRANSADPEALVLRGRALYAQGENEKAIQHFRKALSCDPDFKNAVTHLRMVQKIDRRKEEGNSYFKAGRFQEAVDVYTTALDVDPLNKGTNSKLLNNRAMCYLRLKKWPAAIEDCDKAVRLDPGYTKALKTRAKALGEAGNWEEAARAYKQIQEQSPEEPGIAKELRNAELELKKSKRKDFYKILGVEKDAGETEIKRAYRKLAVKHHPDKNIDDPDAENRFKDIQEAHETLTDPQKRERYDSGVDLMDPSEQYGGGNPFGAGGGVQIDPSMLFNFMNGGGGGGGFSFQTGGSGFGGGIPRGQQRGFPGGGYPF